MQNDREIYGVEAMLYIKVYRDCCIPVMPSNMYECNTIEQTPHGAAISTEPTQLRRKYVARLKPPLQASMNHFLHQFRHAAREVCRSKITQRTTYLPGFNKGTTFSSLHEFRWQFLLLKLNRYTLSNFANIRKRTACDTVWPRCNPPTCNPESWL